MHCCVPVCSRLSEVANFIWRKYSFWHFPVMFSKCYDYCHFASQHVKNWMYLHFLPQNYRIVFSETTVFWDVTLCRLVDRYHCFGRTCLPPFWQYKMKEAGFSRTLICVYQEHIVSSQKIAHNNLCCETLKSHIALLGCFALHFNIVNLNILLLHAQCLHFRMIFRE